MFDTAIALGKHQRLRFTILAAMVGSVVGCSYLAESGFNHTEIGDLKRNWQNYSTVYVRGTVGDRAPFLETGAYQLQDGTGSIWVVGKQPLPERAEEVLIKGQVKYQSIPIAGRDFGEVYIEQQKLLQRSPAPASN